MNIKKIIFLAVLLLYVDIVYGQNEGVEISFKISVVEKLQSSFNSDGRLLIYLSETPGREPRYTSIYNGGGFVFGKNIVGWKVIEALNLNENEDWEKTPEWSFSNVPQGKYYVQAVWNQNSELESRSNTPGNLYSEPLEVSLSNDQEIAISLTKIIPKREIIDHELVEIFSMKSEVLSKWWNKPMKLRASVLLPSGYESNPLKKYPVRYNVAGYGGRYTRVSRLVKNTNFISWWSTEEAPQIITVFLDGEGPFGDSYQLDSDNNGPYGQALITELIPAIEKQFRIIGSAETRFVDGCSTGGWVSLALQLFYPEIFNGCWSYSPDPVSFHKMQLVNIYEDENAFYNKNGFLRPSMRDLYGEPVFSIEKEVIGENVQGYSNSYTTSGGQWGAWNAVYSPKGKDGLPMPAFDPNTGDIDTDVAQHWKRYDLLHYIQENWPDLGPKIQGKIHIWTGDMDNFYLNNAMRDFDKYIQNTSNPKSDAEIEFSPMKQHCSNYSHKKVLEEIWSKVNIE